MMRGKVQAGLIFQLTNPKKAYSASFCSPNREAEERYMFFLWEMLTLEKWDLSWGQIRNKTQ